MCAAKLEVDLTAALSAGVHKIVAANKEASVMNNDSEKQPARSALVQIILGLIANFSSLAPSMSLGFSAIALPALLADENPSKLDESQSSWVASIASIATPIGCFISGPLSDRYGRRTALLCVNVVSFVGWIVIAIAFYVPEHQYSILLTGRLITGLSTGLASMPAAVYMAEVSSASLRGMFTTWNATSFSLGVLIVYALGWMIKDNWGITASIIAIFPCVGMVLVFIYMAESPSWLISRNRVDEAKASMCKVFGTEDYNSAVQEEIETLIHNKEKSRLMEIVSNHPQQSQASKNLQYLLRPTCIKPFVLILAYFFFQQFSGVFVIVFYAVDIVKEVKVTLDPYFAICLIAATRMVAAIIVGILSKRFGRRPLSLISGSGMSICMGILAAYLIFLNQGMAQERIESLGWLPISLLMLYFFTSTLGYLTMPFAMAAEVFPGRIRGMATGLITCIAYIFNFIVVKIYPTMMREMGNYKVFFFYGFISLVGTVFIALFLPETKGKTLQEIEEYFGKKKSKKDPEAQEEVISFKPSAA